MEPSLNSRPLCHGFEKKVETERDILLCDIKNITYPIPRLLNLLFSDDEVRWEEAI